MSDINKEDVERYVESQCNSEVIHSKPEQTYDELGFRVTIWNVKTDKDGSWWVAAGGGLPMNLYSQDKAYYFATDEVYSFHLGLMMRLLESELSNPENFVGGIAKGVDISEQVRRKLHLASEKLVNAVEVEEIQAIGVMCRETLLVLIETIFELDFLTEGDELPKKSDFKGRSDIAIRVLLPGSDNDELRKHMKNLAFGAWDFSNKLTHSTTRTVQEASICLTLCIAVASSFENLLDKYHDPLSGLKCRNCGSRHLVIAENETNSDLLIICEACEHGFLKEDNEKTKIPPGE